MIALLIVICCLLVLINYQLFTNWTWPSVEKERRRIAKMIEDYTKMLEDKPKPY